MVAVSPSRAAPVRSSSTAADASGGGDSSDGGRAAAATSPAAATPAAAVPQQTVTVPAETTPAAGDTTPTTPSSPTSLLGLPPVKHVWLIVLSQQGYNQAFATSTGHPYLSTTLRRQGELLADYYGVAGSPLANEVALLSGQGPTPQTIAGCPEFDDITPGTLGKFNQARGTGCLYPESAETLPDQLAQAGLSWRAYVDGIGETLPTPATFDDCVHADDDHHDGGGQPTTTPTDHHHDDERPHRPRRRSRPQLSAPPVQRPRPLPVGHPGRPVRHLAQPPGLFPLRAHRRALRERRRSHGPPCH